MWRIETRDVRTGKKQSSHATALVSAIGVLVGTSNSKVAGHRVIQERGVPFGALEARRRPSWKARRRAGQRQLRVSCHLGCHFHPCAGRNIIACLCRTQFIPVITEDPTVTIVNFARTAMWYFSIVGSPFGRKKGIPSEIRFTAETSLLRVHEMGIC